MVRIEFDLKKLVYEINTDTDALIEDKIKNIFKYARLPLYIDHKLSFHKKCFNKDLSDFVTFNNGYKKGGTLRFKENYLRIPKDLLLPVYESEEYETFGKKHPKAFTNLTKLIISNPFDLTNEDLAIDGFDNHSQLMDGLQKYYPNLSDESLLSFYVFGNSNFKPSANLIKSYFEKRAKD